MTHLRLPSILLLLAVAGCAASPEDVQMSNALCDQGKTLLAAGKNQDAHDVYASAVTRNAGNARAWNGLGAASDMLGQHRDARDAYKRAVDLNPQDISAVNNLAHAYLTSGDPDQALALLQPYAGDANAPKVLRQNLELARQAVQNEQNINDGNYAELNAAPTEGMAQGRVREAKSILGSKADDLNFSVVPEVNVPGGVPMFAIKITGAPPQDICDKFNAQAMPCVPHGK